MNIAAVWEQLESIRRQRWEQSIRFQPRQVPDTWTKTDETATDPDTIRAVTEPLLKERRA